ncbi:hypothetical protein [Thioalkalivibrio sp. ALJ1]|uniref:hypothetical protein n=1 Tax=Thioalkalivibrio sp. ALJ1 TaxID=1158144 RepID=UPI0012E063CC|nr:hypothetical protein [Thioalkalivibrio sp. ALJ1]
MRLVLHAGTHKTATTSLQRALHDNVSWLRASGVEYAQFSDCKRSHNMLAHRLAQVLPAEVADVQHEIMRQAERADVLVLSAEEFSVRALGKEHWHGFGRVDHREKRLRYLDRLAMLADSFDDVSVYVCFREREQYAKSLYATNLLSGLFNWSLGEFVSRCVSIFDYETTIRDFRERFSNVNVARFEDVRKGNLVSWYCDWFGIPRPPGIHRVEKVTPDSRLVMWVYERSRDGEAEAQRLRGRFARSKYAKGLFSGNGGCTLWLREDERVRFLSSFPVWDDEASMSRNGRSTRYVTEAELKCIDESFERWCSGSSRSAR